MNVPAAGTPCYDRLGVAHTVREVLTFSADRKLDEPEVAVVPDAHPTKLLRLPLSEFRKRFRAEKEAGPVTPGAAPAESAFAVGAAVRLKGGSPNDPIMTVLAVVYDAPASDPTRRPAEIKVAYVPVYGPEGKIVRDSFPPGALRVVRPGGGPPPAEET